MQIMEKLCIVCKKQTVREKPKRCSYCIDCNRAIGRKNYRENKERYFAQARKRNCQLDDLINSQKNRPCTDCKNSYPPFVMDFDHLGHEKKIFNISHMRRHKMSFDKIKAEILKCEVVCSNCHRIRSNSRQPARYLKN